jgi:hypothetical protein
MRTAPPRLRLLSALVAVAVGLTATPLLGVASAADPLPPLADPTAPGAFCDGASGENPFDDLDEESPETREVILCLVDTGLTQGTTATTYSPGAPVTRRQMSLFIKRLADLLNQLEETPLADLPLYDGVPDYPDVILEDLEFQEAIGQLTQADIVGGFPDGTFRPGALVSRRQMAAFVNRLEDFLTGEPFTTTGDYFDDDDGDTGEADLNALASVGIFQGDGAGRVSPGAPLSRRQMANILLRYAQVHFDDGSVGSPFTQAPPPDQTPPTSIFAKMTTAVGNIDEFDAGDVVTIVFSEPLQPPNPAAAVRLSDGVPGASAADIVNGTSATFALNADPVVVAGSGADVRPPGSVLTITLTAVPTPVSPLDPVLEVPATIGSASGISDTAGQAWNVVGSSDVTVER